MTQYPFINIHTHKKPNGSNETIIRNAFLHRTTKQLTNIPYGISIGLHPWYLNSLSINECADLLSDIASTNNVIAIGEIGIDRSIDIPIGTQLNYFEIQWNIARALQKPLIIHAVKSYSDLIPYVKKTKIPFIFHQFSGNQQQANELLKQNAYLSFGKNLFNEKSALTFKYTPIETIFLETDNEPYLTIKDIYLKAAELKELEMDELKSIVFHNFARVFGG